MSLEMDQHQILHSMSIETNANFVRSGSASLDQKLRTAQKNSIVRAVNELVRTIESAVASSSLQSALNITGDAINNVTLRTQLDEMGGDLTSALYLVRGLANTLLAKTIEIPILTTVPTTFLPGESFIYNNDGVYKLYTKGNVGGPDWLALPMEVINGI